MIVNDASSGVNKLKASLNDATRVVIYDRHMFIVIVTGLSVGKQVMISDPVFFTFDWIYFEAD